MLDVNTNYDRVFEAARRFAQLFSNDISVDESHKESICVNGVSCPCVPLTFPAKGSRQLLERLMQTGFCSSMKGKTVGGHRMIRVLLWIDPETYSCRKAETRKMI